ncbi:unnamed protein product [Effrenium voratum]|nr:unnamed protein product [Effrenium voratum]
MAMRRCCRLFRDVACLLHAFNRTNYIAQNGMRTEDRTQDPPEPTTYDKDEITISQFADEIYQKVWPGTVTLKDPKKGELDIVSGGGWRDLVIWNPYGDDKMGYKTFVCVESVEGEPVPLKPGAAWDATVKLVARNT